MKHRKVPKVMGRPVNNGRSSATGFTVVSPATSVVSLKTCPLTYFHLINVLRPRYDSSTVKAKNPPHGNDSQKVVTNGLRNPETNEACFF